MLCSTQMINSRSMVLPLPAAYSNIFSPSLNKIRASLYAPTSIFLLAWLLILFTLFTKFSVWWMGYPDRGLTCAFRSVRARWRWCNPRHYVLMNADFIFLLGWSAQTDSSFPSLIKNIYNIWHVLITRTRINLVGVRKVTFMEKWREIKEKKGQTSIFGHGRRPSFLFSYYSNCFFSHFPFP